MPGRIKILTRGRRESSSFKPKDITLRLFASRVAKTSSDPRAAMILYAVILVLLVGPSAQAERSILSQGNIIADIRLAEQVEDVDTMQFIHSISNLKLKNAVFPRYAGLQNGYITFSKPPEQVKPKLSVVVPNEPRAKYPHSVTPIKGPSKIKFESTKKTDMIDDLKTLDLDDLIMHSLGATQALVRVTFDLSDRFNESQLTWQERFYQLKAHVDHLQTEVLMFRGQIGLFNETYKLAENRAKMAEIQLLESQKAIAADQRRKEELLRNRTTEEEESRRKLTKYDNDLKLKLSDHQSKLRKEDDKAQEALRFESEKTLVVMRKNSTISAAKEAARINAEIESKRERENEDVRTRLLREQGLQDRRRWRELVEAVSNAILQLLADPDRLTALVAALSAIFVGMYAARELSRVVAERLKEWLYEKPALVRETSRSYGIFTRWSHFARDVAIYVGLPFFSDDATEDTILQGVVLQKSLDVRVRTLVSSIKLTTKHGAPLRHILFHGPPGTGKTMVARRVAYHSGLEFAIMSGGDVAPLKERAVTEIHKLVNWAKRTHKGMLLFIDEAEAFVGSRRSDAAGFGPSREALNALLYHTGTATSKFMMVLATNRPEDLDSAITDRIDDALNFGLPQYEARERLILTYFDKYVADISKGDDQKGKKSSRQPKAVTRSRKNTRAKSRTRKSRGSNKEISFEEAAIISAKDSDQLDNSRAFCFKSAVKRHIKISVDPQIDSTYLTSLADDFEGFSGREISKFMLAVQGLAHASPGLHLKFDDMQDLVKAKVKEHEMKENQRTPQ